MEFLATQKDIDLLTADLQAQLQISDPNEEVEAAPDLDLEHGHALDGEWLEGVEAYKDATEDELWAALGVSENKRVPFFNSRVDPGSNFDPWTEEGREWFSIPGNGQPLQLRWHQLVGVLRMLENFFDGKPILEMDGVGLGKTIQMAAALAFVRFYQEFYTRNGKFPGKFGKFCNPSL